MPQMATLRPRLMLRLTLAAGLVLAAGCQSSAPPHPAVRTRHEKLPRTWNHYVAEEAARGDKLAYTWDRWMRALRQDAVDTENLPRNVGAYLESDIKRWEANQPAYRDKTLEQLRGQPEHIGENALNLIY